MPEACLKRMLESEAVRQEYREMLRKKYCNTYREKNKTEIPDEQIRVPEDATKIPERLIDKSRKLTLENIVELALINSRDYQTQKEQLYFTALNLTFTRFDYVTKPSAVRLM